MKTHIPNWLKNGHFFSGDKNKTKDFDSEEIHRDSVIFKGNEYMALAGFGGQLFTTKEWKRATERFRKDL